MLRSAQKKYLVVDHTKFEGTANHLFEGLEEVDAVITDQMVPEDFEVFAARRKIQILYTQG
jgi:DeoR family transcriptional regulator of aga operon